MTLENIISELKKKLLAIETLETAAYFFLKNQNDKLQKFTTSEFTGEVETIALKSFLNEFVNIKERKKIERKISKNIYKGLSIYHYIGLSYQDFLWAEEIFSNSIQEYFINHSFKYKFLIAKFFDDFEDKLILSLEREIENNDIFILSLKQIFLEKDINFNKTLRKFHQQINNLDVIDLLLLEDLRDRKAIGYNKIQKKLEDDIFWMVTHIQSKHKTLNNSEDQYNSLFDSLLEAKGYKTQPQTQRGQSSTGKTMGELDIMIFTENGNPLSIFEAFKLKSIDRESITKHLKKLSENYDSNGININYAVIYAQKDDFLDLWTRYKKFVPTVDFKHKLIRNELHDITTTRPQYSGLKLGYTEHLNRENKVKVYHIFMDMNFKE